MKPAAASDTDPVLGDVNGGGCASADITKVGTMGGGKTGTLSDGPPKAPFA